MIVERFPAQSVAFSTPACRTFWQTSAGAAHCFAGGGTYVLDPESGSMES